LIPTVFVEHSHKNRDNLRPDHLRFIYLIQTGLSMIKFMVRTHPNFRFCWSLEHMNQTQPDATIVKPCPEGAYHETWHDEQPVKTGI